MLRIKNKDVLNELLNKKNDQVYNRDIKKQIKCIKIGNENEKDNNYKSKQQELFCKYKIIQYPKFFEIYEDKYKKGDIKKQKIRNLFLSKSAIFWNKINQEDKLKYSKEYIEIDWDSIPNKIFDE